MPPLPAADERSLEVDIDLLRPNKFQPRTHMDDGRIDELARSIRSNGVIQPIVVRKAEHGYEIVAGERRWRASQRAGLLKVPVVVRDIPDDRLLAAALIENIQREDLNPIEEAHAYRRLGDEFGLTQEQIAESVGKDRSSVANYVRLLRLPEEIRDHVGGRRAVDGARPRAARPAGRRQRSCASAARSSQKGLSVRETEALVKRSRHAAADKPRAEKDVHTRAAEERLRFALGTRVRIVRKGKGGRIEIDFGDENELHRIYSSS